MNGVYLSYNKSRTAIKKREFLQDILNLKARPDNCNGAFDATDCMRLVEVIWVGLIKMMGDTSGLVLRVFKRKKERKILQLNLTASRRISII